MKQGGLQVHFLREHHAGKSEIISAVQADYAVNLNTRGTPVRLLGWLFYASARLFLTASVAGTAPAECGRSQKKGTTRGRALAPPLKVPLF